MSDKIHIDPQIKEYIALFKELVRHILKYWYLLIIFLILANFVSKSKKKPTSTRYVATLTFTINTQSADQEVSEDEDVAASLVTTFSGGMGNYTTRINRLMELSKSTAVLSAVLFRTYEVEGDTNYLANHFLNIYNPNITDSTYFENFVSLDSLNRVENAVLNGILRQMRGRNVMFSISPAMIFKLTTSSVKEELSKVMAEAYYDALSQLYIDGTISKAQSNLERSEKDLEEAEENLRSSEAALASWQDRNRNLINNMARLSQNDLQRQARIYSSEYSSALRTYKSSQSRLENLRPLFQLIDPPRYPLQRVVSGGGSIYKIAMMGAIAMYFFVTIALFAFKKYGYLLKEIWEA